jgi:hypothetical protein
MTFVQRNFFVKNILSLSLSLFFIQNLIAWCSNFCQMTFVQIAFVQKQLLGKYFIPLSPPFFQDLIAWCGNFLSIDICSKTFICEK